MNKNRLMPGHIAAFFTVFVWGTTFVSTKVLLRNFSPIEILLIRFVLGYLALWLIFPKMLKITSLYEEKYYLLAGITGITLYYLLENIALTYTQASNVGVAVAVAPFFTSICSRVFLKEKLPGKGFYIGFLLAMGGIYLISFQGDSVLQINPFGDMLAVFAAIIWAFYSTFVRRISQFGHHTVQTTRRIFFYGLVFMVPAVMVMGFDVALKDFQSTTVILNFLFLSFVAGTTGFITWNFAVKRLGSTKTSVYIYMSTVVTTLFSVLILHEKITARAIMGIILVLSGLLLSQTGNLLREFKGSKK